MMRLFWHIKFLIRRWRHERNLARAEQQAEWVAGICAGFRDWHNATREPPATSCHCLAEWDDEADCICDIRKEAKRPNLHYMQAQRQLQTAYYQQHFLSGSQSAPSGQNQVSGLLGVSGNLFGSILGRS